MSADKDSEKHSISNAVTPVHHGVKEKESIRRDDNVLLAKLGYRGVFRREFSVSVLYDLWSLDIDHDAGQLVETVAFSFSIMGVIASVTSTFSFPLAAGRFLAKRHWTFYN
jgi:regulatory protein YycI of two-component signal transduction system YycFG